MTLKIQSTRFALNNSTGTQDITISGFGTPKAALLMVSLARVGNEEVNHATLSMGITDGTNQYCDYAGVQDNRDLITLKARTYRSRSADDVILLPNDGNPNSRDIRAEFSQWVTDGIQINITNATSTNQYYVNLTLFGGSDIDDTYIGYFDTGTTEDVDVPITAPGFQADLVFMITGGGALPIEPPDISSHAFSGFGIWSRNDNTQMGVGFTSRNGADPVRNAAGIHNAASIYRWNDGPQLQATLNTNANGFNFNASVLIDDIYLGYLAIKWATTPNIELVEVTLPSTSVDYTETGFSFEPEFGMIVITNATTSNSWNESANNGLAFSVLEDGQIFTTGFAEDDNESTTTDSCCWSATGAMSYHQSNQTTLMSGALESIDSNGWTIDLGGGTHDNRARKGFALAIKSGSVSGATLTDIKLVDLENSSQSSLISLKWDWFDQASPNDFTAPVNQGTVEATDANGNITIDLTNSTLASGQTGFLILRDATNNFIGGYRLDVD